jgi:hypothetical protein
MSTRFASWPRGLVLLLAAGSAAALAFGLYAARGERTTIDAAVPTVNAELENVDLKYYREVVTRVHDGENYYDVANQRLRDFRFRVGSIFNWRLPTYAYVLGALPSVGWAQGVLSLIGLAGLLLAVAADNRDVSFLAAGGTFLLQFGVFFWCIKDDCYLAQEVWAAMLILLSVGAAAFQWRVLAVGAGLAALCFRELVLPYCLVAAGVAWWYGRRKEAAAWLVGVGLFFVYLGWHAGQVTTRLTPADRADSRGVSEWITFGGLTFDILTARMNLFVLDAPGWLVFLYLATALIGLLGWRGEQGALVALTTIVYLAAFAVVGMPMNVNWGLMYAPLLPFGVVRAPGTILDLANAVRGRRSSNAMVETTVEQLE